MEKNFNTDSVQTQERKNANIKFDIDKIKLKIEKHQEELYEILNFFKSFMYTWLKTQETINPNYSKGELYNTLGFIPFKNYFGEYTFMEMLMDNKDLYSSYIDFWSFDYANKQNQLDQIFEDVYLKLQNERGWILK